MGSSFFVILEAKYGEVDVINIYDDYGVACEPCIEHGSGRIISAGNLKLKFE